MEKAQELLKLDTLPRELAVSLIQKIEIGEQDPDTGQQEVKNPLEILMVAFRGPRRSPAERVRWGEETRRNE